LQLQDFVGARIQPYAILSHTWGEGEVSFKDMRKYRDAAKRKAGYPKVQQCCEKAWSDGYQWVWIDTCCIDKRSSAELSEAINSMWNWYQKSEICYAYLVDVPSSQGPFTGAVINDTLAKSRWFTRGWTLQELIAPRIIQFFGQDWNLIGQKVPPSILAGQSQAIIDDSNSFLSMISVITGIEIRVLQNPATLSRVAAAKKMFWASKRETTREEDVAYSLMGLFGVSMPILYGEGLEKAFRRLQLDIIQRTTDQSIFVWKRDVYGLDLDDSGLLADSPLDFAHSNLDFFWLNPTLYPYSMTNVGLLIKMPFHSREYGVEVISLGCCKSHVVLCPSSFRYLEKICQDEVTIAEPNLGVGTDADLKNHEMRRIELRVEQLSDPGGPVGEGENLYRRDCSTFDIVDWYIDSDENRHKEIYVLQDEQYNEYIMNSEIGNGG